MNQYVMGLQCVNVIVFVMGLVDLFNELVVLENIVVDVEVKGLIVGDVGFCYLLCVLVGGNCFDVIFKMVNQLDKFGYGMQFVKGVMVFMEVWDVNFWLFYNYFMFGQIMEWFFYDFVGIQSDLEVFGFGKVVIKLIFVGDLIWFKVSYDLVYGRVVSEWS